MRFSRSNSFHGNPVSGDVLLQWGPVILRNVTAESFSGGQPAWFMTQDSTDQTWWYVEVTPEDLRLVSPRDVPELISDDEDHAGPVNTHGLDDNCYYVTAAALAGTTIDDLVRRTELMQVRGGSDMAGVVELFTQAGLSSVYHPYNSLDDVEKGVAECAAGLNRKFGLAFTRSNGTGHMVVAKYDAIEQKCSYYDHQTGTDAENDVKYGQTFFLFPQ